VAFSINRGRLLATDSFFTNNSAASNGGGIFTTSHGESFFTEVGIRNNIASSLGGGLANFGDLSVVDSIFKRDQAKDGRSAAIDMLNLSSTRLTVKRGHGEGSGTRQEFHFREDSKTLMTFATR